MKFAAFTTVAESAGEATNAADLLDNLRQETILAEELGYDAMWLGEHHFGPYAAGDIPNPILLGADLAARTSRIRIGQMANIAPWWHPIRLGRRRGDSRQPDPVAGLRWVSGGGYGRMKGRSSTRTPTPAKDKENRALFRETIEVAREVWTNEYFSYKGENYNFPAEDTRFSHPLYPPDPRWLEGDRVTKLRVTPRPYQKPHPPLWMTVSTDRSVTTAAELGLKACYWQPPALRIKQRMELYAEVRSKRDGRLFTFGEDQAVMRTTYVSSSMEQARRESEAGVMSGFIYNDPFRGRFVFTNPGEELDPETKLRLGLPGAPDTVGRLPRECHREGTRAPGGVQFRLPARCILPFGNFIEQDAEEHGDLCDKSNPVVLEEGSQDPDGRILTVGTEVPGA